MCSQRVDATELSVDLVGLEPTTVSYKEKFPRAPVRTLEVSDGNFIVLASPGRLFASTFTSISDGRSTRWWNRTTSDLCVKQTLSH